MAGLAEEIVLVCLSPDQGRNTRAHGGLLAAACAAMLLGGWVNGLGMPSEAELKRQVRKHFNSALEVVLGQLTSAGLVRTAGGTGGGPALLAVFGAIPRIRREWLADPGAALAIRARLASTLSGPAEPGRHDAGLAVLLHSGRLWDWAAMETATWPGSPGPPGTLRRRAEALTTGALVPAGADRGDLPAVARVVDQAIRRHED